MNELFQNIGGTLVPAYPFQPGFKQGGTSMEAAQSMSERAPTLRDRVLAVLTRKPATADELADALGETPFSIRPRCTELVRMGRITETNERRRNESGRMATVWRVK